MTQASATAQNIVDVAAEFLQTRGYHAFSFRDIAAQLGIRSASVHYHFPTKDALATAVSRSVLQRFSERADRITQDFSDPVARLRAFAGIFVDTFAGGDRLCPFCMLAVAQDTLSERLRAIVLEFWLRSESWIATVLREAVNAGRLACDFDVDVASQVWIATLEGSLITARAAQDTSRVAMAVEFLLEQMFELKMSSHSTFDD